MGVIKSLHKLIPNLGGCFHWGPGLVPQNFNRKRGKLLNNEGFKIGQGRKCLLLKQQQAK